MQSRISFDQIYMQMAGLRSQRSTSSRSKVGCVIVSNDNQRVLSVGYNGGPKGLFNECQSLEAGSCQHIHAELNALCKCNYNDPASKKLYTTLECCPNCAIACINSGIKEVIYLNEYRLHDGIRLLNQASIVIRKFDKDNLLYPEGEIINAKDFEKA